MSSHRSLILSSFCWTACLISASFSLRSSDSGPADPALSHSAAWCGRPSWALLHSHLSLSLALLWMQFCLSFLFLVFPYFQQRNSGFVSVLHSHAPAAVWIAPSPLAEPGLHTMAMQGPGELGLDSTVLPRVTVLRQAISWSSVGITAAGGERLVGQRTQGSCRQLPLCSGVMGIGLCQVRSPAGRTTYWLCPHPVYQKIIIGLSHRQTLCQGWAFSSSWSMRFLVHYEPVPQPQVSKYVQGTLKVLQKSIWWRHTEYV